MQKKPAMNAVSLYITTCRYVIQSNPHDSENWSELQNCLPRLRQALSCCVCTQILHIPMGPAENVCQHHVCKDCLGGKKRLKPACSWCKKDDDFIENVLIRIVVQCFKKLCEYLQQSAVANNLANVNNGGTKTLLIIIQEGIAIHDLCNVSSGSSLGLLAPKLHNFSKCGQRKEERKERRESKTSINDKGEGHKGGSNHFTKVKTSASEKRFSSETSKHKGTEGKRKVEEQTAEPDTTTASSQEKCSETGSCKPPRKGKDLYETVVSEHDYNRETTDTSLPHAIPKVRIRKIEGDHESLIKRPKLTSEAAGKTVKDYVSDTTEGAGGVDSTTSGSDGSPRSPRLHDSASPSSPHVSVKNGSHDSGSGHVSSSSSKGKSSKKKLDGCRCGLATPNPGKLTCCGQRCPCYSAFKGCVDCRCRGCRNPRGDIPGPLSIKFQLQQQHQGLIGQNPQIILQPIKVEHEEHDSDIDIDI